MQRLSALIVDYHTAGFALGAARSLEREWKRAGRSRDALEFVVVDNSLARERDPKFGELERLGARILRANENLGYGRGMNLALEHSKGASDDWIAVLNPDLHFLPHSLEALFEHANDPSVGALAPACFVDPLCAVELPPNPLPTPERYERDALAQTSARAARELAFDRVRSAAAIWSAREPRELEMLSGAALFLCRATIARLGELFDPRYPLYFEDTDLCRRLRELDLRLVFEPRSRIVHHWARSSGVGAEFEGEPRRRNRISERAFFERWHGASAAARVESLANELAALDPAQRCPPIHAIEMLGETREPIEIHFGRSVRAVLELSMSPNFPLAAGVLVDGERWKPDARTWEWFFPGRYFVRALDRESFELIGAWSFDKLSPVRAEPLRLDETERDRGSFAEIAR